LAEVALYGVSAIAAGVLLDAVLGLEIVSAEDTRSQNGTLGGLVAVVSGVAGWGVTRTKAFSRRTALASLDTSH
jgi:hypothetical protein